MSGKNIKLDSTAIEADISVTKNTLDSYLSFAQNVYNGISCILTGMDPVLQRNIGSKLTKTMNIVSEEQQMLFAIYKTLINCKETYEEVDKYLAREYSDYLSSDAKEHYNIEMGQMEKYCSKATDAEFAMLCHALHKIRNETDKKAAFKALLKKYLPEKSPLRDVSDNQITIINGKDDFLALTIEDGQGNALVIYDSTDFLQTGDLDADVALAFSAESSQSKQAIALMNEVAKTNSNITTVGHSLGGYLATAATLKTPAVTKCVAFDPPGRTDVNFLDYSATSKITTYEAVGSEISGVHTGVGNVIKVDVKENGAFFWKNHGIVEISNALNKQKPMESAWE